VKPHSAMFHHFHSDKHIKGQGSISSEQFRAILIYLKENYNLIDAHKWYWRSKTWGLGENDVCISFDDNLLCQYDVALPVLDQLGIKAFWFIYTSPLEGIRERLELYRYFRFKYFDTVEDFYEAFFERFSVVPKVEDGYLKDFPFYTEADRQFRYTRDVVLGQERYYKIMDAMIEGFDIPAELLWNTKENIKRLHERGHIIGLHSHTHPTTMARLSRKQQYDEYSKNIEAVECITGVKPFAMSHPCNSYNDTTLEVLRELGINFGFRANMDDGFNSTLEFPRIDHALLLDKI